MSLFKSTLTVYFNPTWDSLAWKWWGQSIRKGCDFLLSGWHIILHFLMKEVCFWFRFFFLPSYLSILPSFDYILFCYRFPLFSYPLGDMGSVPFHQLPTYIPNCGKPTFQPIYHRDCLQDSLLWHYTFSAVHLSPTSAPQTLHLAMLKWIPIV